MKYTYKTKGTCSTQIDLEINGDIVSNVKFYGGCNGNLQAIPALIGGITGDRIEERRKDSKCRCKNTSWADQMAHAIREAYTAEQNAAAE